MSEPTTQRRQRCLQSSLPTHRWPSLNTCSEPEPLSSDSNDRAQTEMPPPSLSMRAKRCSRKRFRIALRASGGRTPHTANSSWRNQPECMGRACTRRPRLDITSTRSLAQSHPLALHHITPSTHLPPWRRTCALREFGRWRPSSTAMVPCPQPTTRYRDNTKRPHSLTRSPDSEPGGRESRRRSGEHASEHALRRTLRVGTLDPTTPLLRPDPRTRTLRARGALRPAMDSGSTRPPPPPSGGWGRVGHRPLGSGRVSQHAPDVSLHPALPSGLW